MNQFFQNADKLVREAISDLEVLLGKDGDDISSYNPVAIDAAIGNLIKARSQIAIGRYLDE